MARFSGLGTKSTCSRCKGAVEWSERPVGEPHAEAMWRHVASQEPYCPYKDKEEEQETKMRQWMRDRVDPIDFCTVHLEDGLGRVCNRPSEEPWGTCGIHNRRQKENQRYNEDRALEREQQAYFMQMLEPLVEKWNAFYDLDCHMEKDHRNKPTGYLAVNPGRMNDLMAKVEALLVEEL